MRAIKQDISVKHIPTEMAQNYISEMLAELSSIASAADLRELSSLLNATLAATRVDMELEVDR